MADAPKIVRIPTLKTPVDFRNHVNSLGIELPCDDRIELATDSPLARSLESVTINGKRIGNRFAVQPMEGWDGTTTGGITEDVLRRWGRFGRRRAKPLLGGGRKGGGGPAAGQTPLI